MEKNDSRINFCNYCGRQYDRIQEKCICGRFPWGWHNVDRLLTKEERKQINISDEEYNMLIVGIFRFCVNCGYAIEDLNGRLSDQQCFMCGKNPCGLGVEYREKITLSFCEHCGRAVKSRDQVCICGKLPYFSDNDVFDIPDSDGNESTFNFDEDSEVNYCKDCGMPMDKVRKFDYDETVNPETGEVTWKNNHPCNPNSPAFT